MGTGDPSSYLCIPEAIQTIAFLMQGGWSAVREHNRTVLLYRLEPHSVSGFTFLYLVLMPRYLVLMP